MTFNNSKGGLHKRAATGVANTKFDKFALGSSKLLSSKKQNKPSEFNSLI